MQFFLINHTHLIIGHGQSFKAGQPVHKHVFDLTFDTLFEGFIAFVLLGAKNISCLKCLFLKKKLKFFFPLLTEKYIVEGSL